MNVCLLLLTAATLVRGYSIEQRGWSATPDQIAEKRESFLESINNCPDDDELSSNASIACHGVKVMRRMMGQLLDQGGKRNYRLSEGVEFVKVAEGGRNLGSGDKSFLGRLHDFLQTHELRVRLQDFLPSSEEWGRAYNGSLLQQIGEGAFTGRGKKGGGGGLLALALLFKGMLAAIGLGGLGLLAMKALMVSALALMLSAIVGLKKLASKDEGGGGHYVSVVPVHHGGGGHGEHHYRRRKRDLDNSPYRAYLEYATSH